ncbi:MAG: GIY-YIG nuclease family protein [Bacteroidia bacterium]
MNTFIYGLADTIDNQIKYIGKSNEPQRRLTSHINEALKQKLKNSKKLNWIRKVLSENKKIEIIILDEVDIIEWSFWEQWWIEQFKVWGFKLKNGTKGRDFSDSEIEERRCKALKGHIVTQNTRDKISKTVKEQSAKKWTTELRKKSSESALKKFANGYKAKGAVEWKEKGLQHYQFKPIAKYNLKGSLINEFYSVENLVKDFGSRTAYTGSCKYHNIKRGFIYRYINPTETDLPNTKESINETIELYLKRKELVRKNMSEKQKLRWR